MNGATARFIRLGASLAGLVLLGWVLTGQAAKPAKRRVGLPTDWSHRHAIFSMPQTAEEYARLADEPRFWQQLYRREATALPLAPTAFRRTIHRDWAINLGSGPGMGPGNYPAKYSFNLTAASCSDWVVYGTGSASSGSQASIVAFTNLYTGCGGPTVNWAYDTGNSLVTTSPVLSLDGTQVAFVQNDGIGGNARVVLLKWNPSSTDTITNPTTVPSMTHANYVTCSSPPCMTEFQLKDGGIVSDDTLSSIFYDYKNDVAWVGDSLGWLHKFTPFFNGTPAEVTTSPWPLHVNTINTNPLSSPVFDRLSGKVFIGDLGGFMYAISSSTGAVTQSAQLDFGTGIVDGPVLDSTHNMVYVFASSDGSLNAAVYQLGTNFGSGATGSKTTVGTAGSTPNNIYIGSFDYAYFNGTSQTGTLYVCGNTGANPTLYSIPIKAGVMPAAGTAITSLTPVGQVAQCSSVNDIPNPTGGFNGGPAERLFVSTQNNGLPSVCVSGGCIFDFVSAEWQASTLYSVGQQILDPNGRIQTVVTRGSSGTIAPTWGNSAGGEKPDNTVTWINQGQLTANTLPAWTANNLYASTSGRIIDSSGNVEVSTTPGTSGATPPTWPTSPGATTPDGGVVWTNAGPVASFALPSAGGTSGMIEDNVVSQSTQAGASQVYFTTLGTQTCATSGSSGACAVQASQAALQ